jgi:hypothetical protein
VWQADSFGGEHLVCSPEKDCDRGYPLAKWPKSDVFEASCKGMSRLKHLEIKGRATGTRTNVQLGGRQLLQQNKHNVPSSKQLRCAVPEKVFPDGATFGISSLGPECHGRRAAHPQLQSGLEIHQG